MLPNLLAALMWLPAIWTILAARERLADTTLLPAWRWTTAAAAVWGAALAVQLLAPENAAPTAQSLWWLAAILSLCPMIAVLGARRPNVRVWTWFILLPLVAVFGWPVLILATSGESGSSLGIPLPLTLGFALVLLMGAGNYVATRYGLSAALAILGVCLVATPVSEASPDLPWSAASSRAWGTIAMSAAVLIGGRQARRPTMAESNLERVWFDYRDTFGIVWGRRFLERVNQRAVAEKWPCRLAEAGIVWDEPAEPDAVAPTRERIDFTFRWLLRRFVDPEWIDRRLKAHSSGPIGNVSPEQEAD